MTRHPARIALALTAAMLLVGLPAFAQDGEDPEGDVPAEPDYEIVNPQPIEEVAAEYPTDAFDADVQADVYLQIDIGEDGLVSNIIPVEILYYTYDADGYLIEEVGDITADTWGFVPNAVAAMEQFVFEPAILFDAENPEGLVIPVQVVWRIGFVIDVEEIIREVDVDEDYETDDPDGDPTDAPDEEVLAVDADGPVNFEGRLLERGTRRPMADFVIEITHTSPDSGLTAEAVTDSDGRFSFRGLPEGTWEVVIEETEYYPYSSTEEIDRRLVTEVTYYVERELYGDNVSRTTTEAPDREVTRRVIEVSEIQRIPGNNNDAIRVVQNLPGVARASFGGGDVIVRGSAPEDTRFFVDGMNLPLLYHFGGLRSTLPSEMLSQITLYPGAYPAEYGRATGGIVAVELNAPLDDQYNGYIDVNLFETGVFFQGPIVDGVTFQAGARRSYIDAILRPLADTLELNFTTAPRYWDYQLKLDFRVVEDHDFVLFYFTSDDLLDLVLQDESELPPDQRGGVRIFTGFQSVIAGVESRFSEDVTNEFRVQLSIPRFEFNVGTDLFFDLTVWQMNWRDTLEWRASETVTWRGGIDIAHGVADISLRLPRPPVEGEEAVDFESQEVLEQSVNQDFYEPAAFTELDLRPIEPLQIVPGLRTDYNRVLDQWSLDVRLAVRYTVLEDLVLKAGFGTFHQPPTPDQTDEVFGNPELRFEEAIHYVLGTEYQITDYLDLNAELFYKDLNNLVSRSEDVVTGDDGEERAEIYNNGGIGRVFGAELMLRHQLANNFFGWFAYTVSRSERLDDGEDEWRLFDFDQSHIFTVLGTYNLPRNWSVGARFRLVSGNPTTPIIGSVFDADNDTYVRVPGESNSIRQPLFHQLDIRIDKQWIYNWSTLTWYLDLQNVYNQMNQEDVAFSYDYSEQADITGLPIIPAFGLRWEFRSNVVASE